MRRLIALLSLFLASSLFADEPWQKFFSETEFESTAIELAANVDLFGAIWQFNAEAEIYGGASRDFLWFLRKKFAVCRDRICIERVRTELRARPIGVNEFIVGASDVDVISAKSFEGLPFDPSYVVRIQLVSPQWFDAKSSRYQDELAQGGVAVEKIRLVKGGLRRPVDPLLAGGIAEIYRGIPTFLPKLSIRETAMYQAHENHSLLLVLRWIRQVAVAYYQRFGTGFPDEKLLRSLIDERSAERARTVLSAINVDSDALLPFLTNELFRKRLRRQLEKVFRSYTNPTAAKLLFDLFGVDRLFERFMPEHIEPYHTVMYAKKREAGMVAAARNRLNAAADIQTVADYFAKNGLALEDGMAVFFHGTPTTAGYRSIAYQGILASSGGSAGGGVYAVDNRSYDFALHWKEFHRESPTPLVARLLVDPNAKMVDLKSPGGAALWQRWVDSGGGTYEQFADALDLDLITYPYGEHHAYVISNGAVIRGAVGHTVPLMTLPEARRFFAEHPEDGKRLKAVLEVDRSLLPHLGYLLADVPWPRRRELLAEVTPDLLLWLKAAQVMAAHPGTPAAQRLKLRDDFFAKFSRELPNLSQNNDTAKDYEAFAENAARLLGDVPDAFSRLQGPDSAFTERVAMALLPAQWKRLQREDVPPNAVWRELEALATRFPTVFFELVAQAFEDPSTPREKQRLVADMLAHFEKDYWKALPDYPTRVGRGFDRNWMHASRAYLTYAALRFPGGPWPSLLPFLASEYFSNHDGYALRYALQRLEPDLWTDDHWRLLREIPLTAQHDNTWVRARMAEMPARIGRPAHASGALKQTLHYLLEFVDGKKPEEWPAMMRTFTVFLPTGASDRESMVRDLMKKEANWDSVEASYYAPRAGAKVAFLLNHPELTPFVEAQIEEWLRVPITHWMQGGKRLAGLSFLYRHGNAKWKAKVRSPIARLEYRLYRDVRWHVKDAWSIASNGGSAAKYFLDWAAYLPADVRKIDFRYLASDRVYRNYLAGALENLSNFDQLYQFPWRDWAEMTASFEAIEDRIPVRDRWDPPLGNRLRGSNVATSLQKYWEQWPESLWRRMPKWILQFRHDAKTPWVSEWIVAALLQSNTHGPKKATREVIAALEAIRPYWDTPENTQFRNFTELVPFDLHETVACGSALVGSQR